MLGLFRSRSDLTRVAALTHVCADVSSSWLLLPPKTPGSVTLSPSPWDSAPPFPSNTSPSPPFSSFNLPYPFLLATTLWSLFPSLGQQATDTPFCLGSPTLGYHCPRDSKYRLQFCCDNAASFVIFSSLVCSPAVIDISGLHHSARAGAWHPTYAAPLMCVCAVYDAQTNSRKGRPVALPPLDHGG